MAAVGAGESLLLESVAEFRVRGCAADVHGLPALRTARPITGAEPATRSLRHRALQSLKSCDSKSSCCFTKEQKVSKIAAAPRLSKRLARWVLLGGLSSVQMISERLIC